MRRLGPQTGSSFIDVLLAMGLFSVIASGVTTMAVSNIQINSRSRSIAAATALVQDKIEQIRLTAPVLNVTPAELTVGTHLDTGNPLSALSGANGTFTRSWTVTTVPQYLGGTVVGARPAIVEVAVTVSWSTPPTGSMTAVTFACTTPSCG